MPFENQKIKIVLQNKVNDDGCSKRPRVAEQTRIKNIKIY